MKRDSIITLPHENLHKPSTKVSIFDIKLEILSQDMESATLDWEDSRKHELGVALAAIQINQPKKVVIIRNDFEDKTDRTFLTLVNPKIIRLEGEITSDYEGCLSVPDVYGLVQRSAKVKIKAQDLSGKEFRLTADGFLARVLQHEIDHINGVVFVDHIKNNKDAWFNLDENGKLIKVDYELIKSSALFW
jgi:peptide deformylase